PAVGYCSVQDDPATQSVVLFGGFSFVVSPVTHAYNWSAHGETWTYSGGTWVARVPVTSPGPRGGAMTAYFPNDGSVLMFGGTGGSNVSNLGLSYASQSWLYRGGDWFQVPTLPSPSTRAYGGMAFDPVANAAVLCGGFRQPSPPSDTWTFANPLLLSVTEPVSRGADVGQRSDLAISEHGAALPISYLWTGLPSGCSPSILPTVGCFYTATGATNVTVSALDSANLTASVTFPLTVAPPLSAGLAISRNRTEVGSPLTLTADVSGGSGAVRSNWSEVASTLGCAPPANGTVLTCAPTRPGNSTVNISATDANSNTVVSSPVAVEVALSLDISGFVSSSATPRVGQSLALTASVGHGVPPYSFRYAGLPTGCTTVNSAVLSCTPTAPGMFSLMVDVTDHEGVSVQRELNLTVAPGAVGLFGLSPTETYGLIGGLVAAGVAGTILWTWRKRSR
ncbi:MAG: hypothetical protein L3K05_03105, partial [Thermoplasmata archaeon]|nr:hypothetical protein [Thermoplasmata archaeon]